MKIFIYGFWNGFIENTDPVNSLFFLDFFSKMFGTVVEIGNIEDSEILLESIFGGNTLIGYKQWKLTFLFSGENRIFPWYKSYNCVLSGQKNHENIINFPLFIPYLSCRKDYPIQEKKVTKIPPKNICAVITNPYGKERNQIMEEIEKKIPIDYRGPYKNNIPIITDEYCTPEFLEKISEYKCIIAMENSRGETYITEKITHGFRAGIIPIYWGSNHVSDYFNENRFICIKELDKIDETIHQIIEVIQDDDKYLKMVNEPIHKTIRTVLDIIQDVCNLLSRPYSSIQGIYTICNSTFEPLRFNRLNIMFESMGIQPYNNKFICPTYKHTITDEIMQKYVKQNIRTNIRDIPGIGMKRSEISLILNYKSTLEYIYKNYSDGLFLIFESDVIVLMDKYSYFSDFMKEMENKKEHWDLIHIGEDSNFTDYFGKPYWDRDKIFYREKPNLENIPDSYIEDITSPTDKYRLIRKYHTKFTDSLLWNYKGIVTFLNYMNAYPYYEAPLDHYLYYFLETNLEFKHYWSLDTFFMQGSSYGLDYSNIQFDTE